MTLLFGATNRSALAVFSPSLAVGRLIHSGTWQHALAQAGVRGEGLRWPSAGFRREPVVFFQGFVEAGLSPALSSAAFFEHRCWAMWPKARHPPPSVVKLRVLHPSTTQLSVPSCVALHPQAAH